MLFHYKRSRAQTAKLLIFNMFVLPFYLWGMRYFADTYPEISEIWPYAVQITIAIEAFLFFYVLWLLKNLDAFEIKVTSASFEVHHPTFQEWCFTLNPKKIDRIDHHTDQRAHTWISVVSVDGEKYRLCMNYSYSRKRLYDALKKLNPDIRLPENINRFYRKPRHRN